MYVYTSQCHNVPLDLSIVQNIMMSWVHSFYGFESHAVNPAKLDVGSDVQVNRNIAI